MAVFKSRIPMALTKSVFLIFILVSHLSCSFRKEKNTGTGSSGSTTSPYAFSADVYKIIFNGNSSTSCRTCHNGFGAYGYVAFMNNPDQLVTATSQQNGTWRLVVPGDPANSLIYRKVSEASPPVGVQMPFVTTESPLSAADIQAIYDWIANMPTTL